ncbi:MAG: vanadium-dependent haloperoxidase [Aestuariivirga sp.]
MRVLKRIIAIVGFVLFTSVPSFADNPAPLDVIKTWYGLINKLVRHTPTYSPPVAARAYAYLGVMTYEAVASGSDNLQTLAGQLNDLKPLPKREAGKAYDNAVVLNAALGAFSPVFFENTGPLGQKALIALNDDLTAKVSSGVAPDVLDRSVAHGKAIATAIIDWSKNDGGAVIKNMGFTENYKMKVGPQYWVPTNQQALQQVPLLPGWGNNRTFAIPKITACGLKPPIPYSEKKSSAFYKEVLEVYNAGKNLTDDQRALAIFWSDDPLLTLTPAGHGVSIALQIIKRDNVDLEKSVDVLARLGVVQADAMIGAWHAKYIYGLLRPITYIHRHIDKKWESLLITPPFPDYLSGHSVQAGSMSVVMTHEFGDNFAFEDKTGESDGLPARRFGSFYEAAQEAAMSRLYGGIHYRGAIENGLIYGRCIGEYSRALKTRR